MAEIDAEGELLPDGTLLVYVPYDLEYFSLSRFDALPCYISEFNIQNLCTCRGGKAIAVVYFRAGYAPNDYPSESVSIFALFSCCSDSDFCPVKNLFFSLKMYTFVL